MLNLEIPPAGEESAVLEWTDALYRDPSRVVGRMVRCSPDAPLVQVAVLQRAGAAAIDFAGAWSGAHARILWDEIGAWRADQGAARAEPDTLVNACTAGGFDRAGALGAAGAGLVRAEFLFAVAAAALLDLPLPGGVTVGQSLTEVGELGTLARILEDPVSRDALAAEFMTNLAGAGRSFPTDSLVFVRCFDFGDAYQADGGPRGINLLLRQLPTAVTFLAEVLTDLQSAYSVRFVLAPPMVASYADLAETADLAGLTESKTGARRIGFGWEVETPAAALCTGLWADQLVRHAGVGVTACGIGTNDLTQFTLARNRRGTTSGVISTDRPESHPAVLALLTRLATDCQDRGIPAILSGAAGEHPGFRGFARAAGLLVSVPITSLAVTSDARIDLFLTRSAAVDQLPDVHGLNTAIDYGRAMVRPL